VGVEEGDRLTFLVTVRDFFVIFTTATYERSQTKTDRVDSTARCLLCYLFSRVDYAGAHLSPKSVVGKVCVCGCIMNPT